MAHQFGAGFDDTYAVAFAAIADIKIRQEEVVDEFANCLMVFCDDRPVELHGRFRNEVEHR
ncbi:hypothetical protein D3C75_1071240 [compost metagenome]